MYDFHYDLLTRVYLAYKNNNYKKLKKFCKNYKTNINGGILNLYFMSPKEMKDELDIDFEEYNPDFHGVVTIFSIIDKEIKKHKLFSLNSNYVYGIEGCDYLEIEDLKILYHFGLRSINLVWNNENKYGSGIKSDKGLTKLGEEFLIEAIDLGIGIDLSHMNEKTFNDTISLIKKQKKLKKEVIVYASHSNVKKICNHKRNLTDEQIKKIKEVRGYIGLFSHKNFVSLNNKLTSKEIENVYVEHIKHIEKLLGGLDNIVLSTDDMSFYQTDKKSAHTNIFPYNKIKKRLTKLLKKYYSINDINKIMVDNPKKIIDNLK